VVALILSEKGAQRSEETGWAKVSERKCMTETDWLFITPVLLPPRHTSRLPFPATLLAGRCGNPTKYSLITGKGNGMCHI